MNLLRSELARFWYRPMTRWTTVTVLSLFTIGSILGFTSSKSSGFTLEEQRVAVAKKLRCDPELFTGTALNDVDANGDAVNPEKSELPPPGDVDCSKLSELGQDFWATRILGFSNVLDWSVEFSGAPEREVVTTASGKQVTRPLFEGHSGIVTYEGGTVLLLAAIALGGSYIGADYRTGALEHLLVWDSRRVRVLLTKSISGGVSITALAATASIFLTGLLLLLARFRGTFVGVDNEFWVDLAAGIGRVSITAGAFAVLSISIATVSKHTVGAVASLLSLSILSGILGGFFPSLARWELFSNGSAFIRRTDVVTKTEVDTVSYISLSHSYLTAGLVVAAWTLAALTISTLVFSRRDIT